jgi:hypothetical protein
MNRTMMRVCGLVCGVSACSLLFACGGEPTEMDSESISESSQALLSGTNLVFMSDVTECTATTQANSLLVKQRALTGSTPILVTEGNNCTNNPRAYTSYFGVGWGSALPRAKLLPGNHDYMNGLEASLYINYVRPAGGLTYRTVDVPSAPTWGIIGLDTNEPNSAGGMTQAQWDAQMTWLTARLNEYASTKTCILVYGHHPRFSSGSHGTPTSQRLQALWKKLYDGGVDVVLSGHDHDYERILPMDGAGNRNDAAGMVQIIAGTGGAGLREFSTPTRPDYSGFRMNDKYGLVELSLKASSFTSTFVGTDGKSYDSYTKNCR